FLPEDHLAYSVLYAMAADRNGIPELVTAHHVKPEDLVAMYERLRATQRPLLGFYARFGLLGLKTLGANQEPVAAADLLEIDWLGQFLDTWLREHSDEAEAVEVSRTALKSLRAELQKRLATGGRRKTSPLTENPLDGRDPYPSL